MLVSIDSIWEADQDTMRTGLLGRAGRSRHLHYDLKLKPHYCLAMA